MIPTDDPQPPAPPQTKRWLWIIVTTLLAAFATVAVVQWRQLELLNSTVTYDTDNITWSFFQLETEYLKLDALLGDVVRDPAGLDRDELQTRYDIFVSRIALVEPTHTRILIRTEPIQVETLARIKSFVTVADEVLGPNASRALDEPTLRTLQQHIDQLADPIHDMAMWANDATAAKIGGRNAAVRQQNRLSLALTLFQSALTIVFAAVVVRQLRSLEHRGQTLERLARRLHDARREAEAASRTKSAFLANMSHELRTPFQGMLGMLALVQDGPLTEQQTDQLRTATESANHLLALLNDVLDVSTIENGHLRLVPEPCDLHRLLDDVESLMAGPARVKGLALRVTRDARLPTHVRADPKRLKQILFNLMGNAVKFTESGSVDLRVDVAGGGSADEPLLRFAVHDSGIGMSADTIGRLFQRFSQGDASTSRRYGGTGLGLEISRSLARLMGGDIDVTSEPGVGSRFTLRVPLPRCEAATAAPIGLEPGVALRKLRVLVADDHPVNRKFLRSLLERLGHRVTLCENGRLAVEALGRESFDVVLTDLHMPEMDGFEAARAIRKLPPPAGTVPILALTADAFRETREAATQAGMTGFLAKPVQPADLLASLHAIFGAQSPPAAGSDRPTPILAAAATPPARPVDAAWLDPETPQRTFGELPPGVHAVMLLDFFGDEGGTIASLREALHARDAEQARDTAHALRGVALNLGLARLAASAREIETMAAAALPEHADELVMRLDAELACTRAACGNAGWLETEPSEATDA